MSVRAKVCGVCHPADARMAAAAGADWIGVILAPGQRRTRSHEEAAAIYAAADLPRVGVFVDPSAESVRAAVLRLKLDVVQLHGAETLEFVRDLRVLLSDVARPPLVWKAVRVRTPGRACAELAAWSRVADAVVLDGWSPGAHGGAGVGFDWSAVQSLLARTERMCDLIVAGGLTPENVAGVIRILNPDAVDVSSGVEDAPGRKSAERLRAFVTAAKHAVAAPATEE